MLMISKYHFQLYLIQDGIITRMSHLVIVNLDYIRKIIFR